MPFLSRKNIAVFIIAILCSATLYGQDFIDSGQNITGLYAGSAVWADMDGDGDTDLVMTGKDASGSPVTLIYENISSTLTPVSHSIPGVYFGEAVPGDYDNDGDLDLVIIGLSADDTGITQVWKNNGSFNFSEDTRNNLTGLRYASADWGDYNSDGLIDLVISGRDAFGDPRTILYKNVEAPGINNFDLIEQTLQSFLNIAKGDASFGDYDNDGDLDLVLSGIDVSGFPNTAIYKNGPVGFFVFDNENSGNLSKLSSSTLRWGDADGDGDLDLLHTGFNARWESISVLYENNPVGRLRNNLISGTQAVVGAAAWGDLDNDGDLDIALSGKDQFSDSFGNVLLSQSNGSFTEQPGKFQALRESALALGDYNGDGKLDFVATGVNNAGQFQAVLYQNSTVSAVAAPDPPSSLDPAVVTNDQVFFQWDKGSDAITSSTNLSYNIRIGNVSQKDNLLSSFVAEGPGNAGNKLSFTLHNQLPEGTYTWSVQTINAQYRRSLWSAEQTFKVEQFVSSLQNIAGFQSAASAWGDYDNDGDLDLVVSGTDANGNNRALLYINEDGILEEDVTVNNDLIKFNNGAFAWGDVDNDGDLDLAYTGFFVRESATSGLYINDNGRLTEQQAVFAEVGFRASLDWGDYNNDGYLDLAVMGKTSAGPFVTKVYKNNAGILTEDPDQNLVGYANGKLRWVDYDNDGDLDLSITGQTAAGDNKLRLYENTPANATSSSGLLIEDPDNVNLPSFQSSDLVWGDLDDDGDNDLIVIGADNFFAAKAVVFTNNPTGTLTENVTKSANLRGVFGGSVDLGDYDNDGDPDLVISGFDFQTPSTRIYKNSGATFAEEVLSIFGGKGVDFSSVSFRDIDNDSDLELATLGRIEGSFASSAIVFDNVNSRTNPNAPPERIFGLNSNLSPNGEIVLTWNATFDPPLGDPARDFLTYQIRIGSSVGAEDIISGAISPEIGRYSSERTRIIAGLPSGDYFWSVRAIDNGLAASEWAFAQSFRVDTTPPSVEAANISITPDSAGIGKVTVLITPTENFLLDQTTSPDVNAGPFSTGTDVLVFKPLTQVSFSGGVWVGELDIREGETVSGSEVFLNVGGFTDNFGNVMEPSESVVSFFVDAERPIVEATSPVINGLGVSTNITLSATFNEAVSPASVSDDVLKLFLGATQVGAASNVQVSSDGKTITALFSNLKANTEYRAAIVSTITDKVGNSMAGDFTWQFTTANVITAKDGGKIANADGSFTLTVPPNALNLDTEVSIDKVTPQFLPNDVTFVNVAFQIGQTLGLTLVKPATIKISYDESALSGTPETSLNKAAIDEQKLSIYRQDENNPSSWEKIGGTVDASGNSIFATVKKLGVFGIFEDLNVTAGENTIAELNFSPRVFAPQGTGTLPTETSVTFSIGSDMNVTILIFNTSGRLVRRLADNLLLNAGNQAILWDGKDGDGRNLPSGLYVALVRAGGTEQKKTVAISNK